MTDNQAQPAPLTDDQVVRARALEMAADLGRATAPFSKVVTKWVPWELIYLADYIVKGSMLEVQDSIVLPRPLAAHAAVALTMSPSDEDQECGRRIEAELAKFEVDER